MAQYAHNSVQILFTRLPVWAQSSSSVRQQGQGMFSKLIHCLMRQDFAYVLCLVFYSKQKNTFYDLHGKFTLIFEHV